MTQLVGQYDFEIRAENEVPARPEKLFVPEQLEEAVSKLVSGEIDVTVNTRFRRTVVRAMHDGVTHDVFEVEISWEHFEEEEHYGGDGWLVVCSALAAACPEEVEF